MTQENSIEISLQTNLSYILLPIVRAHYYASYPKQPCVVHEANIWYLCCITLFVLDPSTSFSTSCDSTLTLYSKKNKKIKQNKNKNKR